MIKAIKNLFYSTCLPIALLIGTVVWVIGLLVALMSDGHYVLSVITILILGAMCSLSVVDEER